MIPTKCFFLGVESFSFKQASFAASIFVHDFDMIFDSCFHIFLLKLCQDRIMDRSPVLSIHFSSGRPNRIVGWSYSLSNASYPLAKRRAYLGIYLDRCFPIPTYYTIIFSQSQQSICFASVPFDPSDGMEAIYHQSAMLF